MEFKPNEIPIVDVITRTGVQLQKSSKLYSGFCPLHQDKDTPSLVVYPNTNSWCCFGAGCGSGMNYNGGDVVEWVKQKFDFSYGDAFRWLRDTYGGATVQPIKIPVFVKPEPKPIRTPVVEYWHSLMDLDNRRNWFHGRGFEDSFIDKQMFGWDGQRYIIPVWEGEPGNSTCLGVRRRKPNYMDGPKYVGLSGHNPATIWGRWHCLGKHLVIAFAGELDAARAVQDGFPAFSMVNGAKAYKNFPESWANLWLPDARYLLVVFDKEEEIAAGGLCREWKKQKGYRIDGRFTAESFVWSREAFGKDYCEWREKHSAEAFWEIIIGYLSI